MGFNLESSENNEIKEVPEVDIDSEQLSETEETAENFDDCSLSEVQDINGNDVNSDSLKEAEDNFDDCEAKMDEIKEENPELAEDDDDFNDCGKETDEYYVAEVTYTTDGEVSEEEATEELQEAYDNCDDPEDMQQLKENANENEHIEVQNAEVIERPEYSEMNDSEVTEEEYEQAEEELDEAQENLEAQQEAAQEYQEDLENQINKHENEVQEETDNINNDISENTEYTAEETTETENESEILETKENTKDGNDSDVEEKLENDDETDENSNDSENVNEGTESSEVEETNENTDEVESNDSENLNEGAEVSETEEATENTEEVESDSEQTEEENENTNETAEKLNDSGNEDEDIISSSKEEISADVKNIESKDLEQMDDDTKVETSDINMENDQVKQYSEEEKKSLQERIDDAFEKEEVSSVEINNLREENTVELKSKIEEKIAIKDELKSKFDEVLSKEKGTEEYKQSLQEYNSLQDQKADLSEQISAMEKQQDLLNKKSLELRESQIQKGYEAVAASATTLAGVNALQERYDQTYYDKKPDKAELANIREESCSTINELSTEKNSIRQAMDAKMDEISEYVISNNMDRYDTAHDLRYQQLSAEYNKMKESFDRIEYSIVKLYENNKAISEQLGDEYTSMVELPPITDVHENDEASELKLNLFIDKEALAQGEIPDSVFSKKDIDNLTIKTADYKLEDLSKNDYDNLKKTNPQKASQLLTDYNDRNIESDDFSNLSKHINLDNNDKLFIIDQNLSNEMATMRDNYTGKDYLVYPNPMGRISHMDGKQGQNDISMNEDCGIASTAKGINDYYGKRVTSENRLAKYAYETNNCEIVYKTDGSIDFYNSGGTLEENVKEFYNSNGLSADAYTGINVPSIESLAERIKNGDVATLAVNHDLMWNWDEAQAFDPNTININNLSPEYAKYINDLMRMKDGGVFKADHFVNVSNVVYDKNGNLTHFIVSDTGNGTTKMIEKNYLYRAYHGEDNVVVSAQGCVVAGRR